MNNLIFRSLTVDDKEWVGHFIAKHWGAEMVVVHQTCFWPAECQGFVAFDQTKVVGLVTYVIDGSSCEIISLDSLYEGCGIGTQLIELVRQAALTTGCKRLHLITTNDNLKALHFYQKRGFRLYALYVGAVDESRKIKPEIPLANDDGIGIHDELELEMILSNPVLAM
jgi:GNAT superfamily N-acetyltransferase